MRLSTSTTLAKERRERYYGLRRQGMSPRSAATHLGVAWEPTGRRYERWFGAIERGEEIVPGKGGRRAS